MAINSDDTRWYSYTSSTQTMRTWAKQIQTRDEIPEAFRASFPRFQGGFPYTLLIPEERLTLFSKRPKRLICLLDDQLLVLEVSRNMVEVCPLPFDQVLYFEHGRVLLDSWLKIVTTDDEAFIKFNTTNSGLFLPIIDRLRSQGNSTSRERLAASQDKDPRSAFDHLSAENFKFMNYGKSVVRPGDRVICLAYQPGYGQESGPFGLPLFRQKTTDHLLVLTGRELILIKEDKRVKRPEENRYGGIFTYIRRNQIERVQFISNLDRSDCLMRVYLPDGLEISAEFLLSNKDLGVLRNSLERA